MSSAHTALMCFVRISEQTEIISLNNIKSWSFYNQDGICLLRGMSWAYINKGSLSSLKV